MRQFPERGAVIAVSVLIMVFMLVFPAVIPASPPVSNVPKMRPYAGIGILQLPVSSSGVFSSEPLHLYEEPAFSRIGPLNMATPPSQEWVFGSRSQIASFVVMARKGKWLLITYDDAGREAWLAPGRLGIYQPWDVFFKGHSLRMLPGVQRRFYQLLKQPGGEAVSSVTSKQLFRALRVEGDWLMVLVEQRSLGWLRWRDDDGRLLVGLEQALR